ncbi:MAG: class I SAM-dependent methyltransferase [Anaerolineales bacterium]|jgi:SAM-dependent methyltransferase
MNIAKSLQIPVNERDDKIRTFYNHHPYPPPTTDLDSYRQLWQTGDRLRVDFHLLWPEARYRDDLEILVAGCGTSQAARHAIRQPAAHVTGIDISTTSLHHTSKLKRKHNLKNLHIQELPIERVGELGRQFDKIICTGVLHHLADPDTGLEALRAVLKLEGAMHLMVYAAHSRTGIYMLQEYARQLGITPSEHEIEDLVTVLRELPRGHPLDYLLRKSPDFRDPGALADALLNPRDRAYTVPELFDYIEGCRLTFGRWYRQAPYLPQCGVISRTPHGSRLASLAPQQQYAAVELFRGTLTSHSFIAYRDDCPVDRPTIRFDGDVWQTYIPIRQSRLVCIQKHLPPGAAAVLINQDHVDTDLIHPINAYEKSLFDVIDGQKSITEIINNVATSTGTRPNPETARIFFERLWQYDHVVLDASKSIS